MIKRLVILSLTLMNIVSMSFARQMYVVSVGICNYQNIKGLKNAENDAKDLAELFGTHTRQVTMLIGSTATHDNILRTLNTSFGSATEDDVIVFCFSGHGGKGGLCAYDTKSEKSMVTYAEIQQVLRGCRAKKKLLFIDACFSGGLRSSDAHTTSQQTFSNQEGVMLFLSSRTGETSRENLYSKNGFFTQYLLSGLKGGADTDKNRIITAKEIFTYVSTNVKQRTNNKQNPVMWGKFDDNMMVLSWRKK